MAMSLLYALLDVEDQLKVQYLEKDPEVLADLEPLPPSPTEDAKRNHERRANKKRAFKYYKLPLKQKKEVRKALYDALYHILEYSEVNRDLSMIIGKALCNAINERTEGLPPDETSKLRHVLTPIVAEAIDEIESPPAEQKSPS